MNMEVIERDDIRNVQRRFDGEKGDCCIMTVTWDDDDGEHKHLELKDAEAISASRLLWRHRSEAERIEYLKTIIREHRN